MWISLDDRQWLPWAWSDRPSEGFTFRAPRQGRILLALAPSEQESTTMPQADCQVAAILFDWDKPLIRLTSCEVRPASADGSSVRLTWAAYDENLSQRPMSLHWRNRAGEPWRQVVADLPNSGIYAWPVPAQLIGRDFEVCLRVTDLAGNAAEAVSEVRMTARSEGEAAAAPVPAASQTRPAAAQPADPAAAASLAAQAQRLCDLAQQRMAGNELDQAEDLFRQAVQVDPSFYAARLGLGVLLQRRGRHAEAIGEYQALLALKPDSIAAWRNLALAYMSTRDYSKARITLQKLLAVEPDDPQTWIDLGDVEMLLGRPETARQAWEKARSLSRPDSEPAARAARRLRVGATQRR